jgi:hypothetical protein
MVPRSRGIGYAAEAPNYKHQITNKLQWSKFQLKEKAFWSFEIEIWNLFGIWDLSFEISSPVWLPAMPGWAI